MMLSEHITLANSRDAGAYRCMCSLCGLEKSKADGIEMGSKFFCGKCWRTRATRPQGAASALANAKVKQ